MSSTYVTRNNALVEAVIAQKNSYTPPTLKQVKTGLVGEEEFVRQFYTRVSTEDIDGVSKADLYAAALSMRAFIQKRVVGTPAMRIYNPSYEEHGWSGPYTVIEMVNDDMPFLVDSLTEALNHLGLEIYRIIHPVIKVTRDKEGNLTAVLEGNAKEEGVIKESLIHFEVSRVTDTARLAEVEQDLAKVLRVIRLAVQDWRKMTAKADEVIKEVSQVAPALQKAFPNKKAEEVTNYVEEVHDFLQWINNNNFTFLGYRLYDFSEENGKADLKLVSGSELGIFKEKDVENKPGAGGLSGLPAKLMSVVKEPTLLEITKSNRKSVVHRPIYMDYIGIKRFDAAGNVIGEHRFLGLFTSIVYYQSAKLIPIIRKKMAYVLERAGFTEGGHSKKELASVLEAFPRDELFQISEEELLETCMGIVNLAIHRRVKLFVRKDKFERFVSCIVFIPRERFSTDLRERIQVVLEGALKGVVSTHYTQVTDSPLARLHLIVKTQVGAIPEYNIAALEVQLAELARVWEDTLHEELLKHEEKEAGEKLFRAYSSAFPLAYSDKFSAFHAYWDIKTIEETIKKNKIEFDLYETSDDTGLLQLKIYNPEKQLLLSDIMPILENMGMKIIDEHTYLISPAGGEKSIWIHHFRLAALSGAEIPALDNIREDFETALAKTWDGSLQNDGFNQLILRAGLAWREVVVIRAYSKYLRQAGFTYSQEYIEEALAKHPHLVKLIVDLFNTRFDPSLSAGRQEKTEAIRAAIDAGLQNVSDLTEDRIIRRYVDLTMAILRTNFFQRTSAGNYKPYVSFKFNSKSVPELPLPLPYAEIFVYSARVEAIHLRGGKVARGGLRWSDRREDFRTEVLGLMKAQMAKNAVIVPVGSKGGFVVKQPPVEGGRDAYLQEGIECYKTFLRGVLDITDNIVNKAVVAPEEVVRYDNDDPYLVVAADKGTATFSDIANGISAEYNFWLGDAFASGGSAGYDHKKMGITARGGWVSVMRHFSEMGINTQTMDFTVIGIGDMSGDVFGNGMLLSEHIKLVGAFNHMHIFLDPNPDTAASFQERKRLFALPRSAWTDYDSKLISKGGGIFSRKDKAITLTPEIQELLEIDQATLAPDELIRAMLKAPVDLLWNGGIGTYAKSREQTHEEVGDKANDGLRVNGGDLRCKVIGEGGNLGFTQRGRIEYALNGGRINTDFIDNSAGVDCSDHEVNIKIALGQAMAHGSLTLEQRNVLLEQMTEEVADLVLKDNYLQTQAVTIAEQQGAVLLEKQLRLMQKLEREGLLNRKIEFLPDDEEMAARSAEKQGLTRPELAVLLSYSKLSIYENLLKSNLPDDKYFTKDLVSYFPGALQEKFRKEIEEHQLRREIIATFVTNSMVNRAGSKFFHSILEDTGLKGCDVARAYTIARDAFDLRSVWAEIEALGEKVAVKAQVELFLEVQNLLERTTLWFLRNLPQPLEVSTAVEAYTPGIKILATHLEEMLSPTAMKIYKRRLTHYMDEGIPEGLSRRVAGLEILAAACDIVKVSQQGNLPVEAVGKIYFELGARLNLAMLREYIGNMSTTGYWDRLSKRTLLEDLYDQQMRLTAEVIRNNCNDTLCVTSVSNWCDANEKQVARYDDFIKDLKSADNVDFSMLVVAVKRVEAICGV